MERALIVGCGYTGERLARRLAGSGVDVVGTSTAAGEPPGTGVRLRQLDLLRPAELDLPEARGAVVYYMVSTLARRYDERRAHLPPMQRLLSALERQRPRGLIYLSSTSVYGDRGGETVDEQSPVQPRSPWGRMRVELERAVWDFGRRCSLPACVARLPEIYGPGRGPQERLRGGGYVVRAPGRYSNRVHVDDLVTVLEQLGRCLAPELLLVADDEPTPTLEVYSYTARLMGLDQVPVDEGPVAGDPNRRALITESKRCDNTRLRAWLEQPLRYPSYREGIRAILAAG